MDVTRRHVLLGSLLLASEGAAWLGMPRWAAPRWAEKPLPRLIPASFAGWTSSEDEANIVLPPSDERLMSQIYDAQLARVYRHDDGQDVLLVVACSARQLGGLLIHRPESCYPAAGFAITSDQPQPFELPTGRHIEARFLTAERGARIEQVLYWIRIGQETPTTPLAEQWAAARYALRGELADGALIRMSTVSPDAAAALVVLRRFASDLYAAADTVGRDLLARG